MQASLIDITERKAAEETLRASEERYRRLVENANEGIAVIQDGVMKYVNPRLAAVAGCTAEEMVSHSFLDFTHPDDRQMAIDNYVRRQRGENLPEPVPVPVPAQGRDHGLGGNERRPAGVGRPDGQPGHDQ